MQNVWYGTRAETGAVLKFPIKESKGGGSKYICIHYARGECTNPKCIFIHRPPIGSDEYNSTVDCFGRQRHSDYKEDMAGVGLIGVVNKTIWISPLKLREMDLYKVMIKYGDIEKLRIIREMAFVTFELEAVAQFVRVAMDGKKLVDDSDELRVRWARDHDEEATDEDLKKAAIDLLEKLKNQKHASESNKRRKLEEEEEAEVMVSSLVNLDNIKKKLEQRNEKKADSAPETVAEPLAFGYSSDSD